MSSNRFTVRQLFAATFLIALAISCLRMADCVPQGYVAFAAVALIVWAYLTEGGAGNVRSVIA